MTKDNDSKTDDQIRLDGEVKERTEVRNHKLSSFVFACACFVEIASITAIIYHQYFILEALINKVLTKKQSVNLMIVFILEWTVFTSMRIKTSTFLFGHTKSDEKILASVSRGFANFVGVFVQKVKNIKSKQNIKDE
jgi:hypothetical protein